jgi:hypothetical protein
MNDSGYSLEQLKKDIQEQCFRNDRYVGSYGIVKIDMNTYQGVQLLAEIEELEKQARRPLQKGGVHHG